MTEITDEQASAFLDDLTELTKSHGMIIGGETSALFLAKGVTGASYYYVARGDAGGGAHEFFAGVVKAT